MAILICGGAGYIGSHAVKKLVEKDEEVIVLDNLSTGHKEAVNSKAKLYQGDLRDKDILRKIFTENKVETVMHFAASSLVGESVEKPLEYYENNVSAAINLLQVMKEFKINEFIFSSTAATYGEVNEDLITEDTRTLPTNPYGETKLAIEKLLKWYSQSSEFKYKVFRYFNVAGAAVDSSIGEDHSPETHLIPIVLEVALGKREELKVFGNDYDTEDGTCIRDYIHVEDLVVAHILGIQHLRATSESETYNLGNGFGFSVLDIINSAKKVTGKDIKYSVAKRRPGDPARLVASSERAQKELGWMPKHPSIESIIETAWKWHSENPEGY